jgi:hypothetical protein
MLGMGKLFQVVQGQASTGLQPPALFYLLEREPLQQPKAERSPRMEAYDSFFRSFETLLRVRQGNELVDAKSCHRRMWQDCRSALALRKDLKPTVGHNAQFSHAVNQVRELVTGEAPEVIVYGFTSPVLTSIGETQIADELCVILHDGTTTTCITFSSQLRALLHMLRLYGPENGLIMDENQQTVIKLRGARYKSYVKQYVDNAIGNVKNCEEVCQGRFPY